MKFIDLKAEYDLMKDEIDAAIKNVIDKTQFIMGADVTLLEEEFSAYLRAKKSYGVSSGTDALLFALMAIGIGPGDEVITTPFTFIATAETIALLGATPVFVDIEPDSFNINTNLIKEKITDKTKAIIPVHLYGQSADMDEILAIAKEHNLIVIEDVAQATGAEYKGKKLGVMGDIGCFSFFPSKNLGCYGDGGMVVTNNEQLAKKMHAIRIHGSFVKYEHEMIGCNGRLDTLQAAILRVKLKYFTKNLELRETVSSMYKEKLKDVQGITLPINKADRTHTYNQFTLRLNKRDELKQFLVDQGVPTAIHYPKPLHMQKAFSYLGYQESDFPESLKASCEVMSLPMFPYMKEDQIDKIAKSIKSFFKS